MNASVPFNWQKSGIQVIKIFCCKLNDFFALKKKRKEEMWKGRLNGKNSKLHILLQAPNQIRGSGTVTPSTKRDQVMPFVCTLVNKFEGLDFDYFKNYPQLLWKLLILGLQPKN